MPLSLPLAVFASVLLSQKLDFSYFYGLGLLPLFFYKRFPQWAFGSALFSLFLCYFTWQKSHLTYPHLDCEAVGYLSDFPVKNNPTGKRFQVTLLDNQCGLKSGMTLILRDYRPQHAYDLAQSYRFQLRLQGSAYATVRHAEALASSHAPFYTRWRAHTAQRINQLFPLESNLWARALLLGDRSLFQTWHWQNLQRTGSSHLVAVSGLHLGMLSWLSYRFFIYLGLLFRYWLRPRTLALLGCAVVASLYVLLAGAAPPVIRAALLCILLACHWLWPRLRLGLEALLWAAILQLIIQPQTLFQASAWLSYLAVAALLILHQNIKYRTSLRLFFLQNVLLWLVLLPIVWAVFGGISWVAPLLNMILITCLPMVLLALLLSLLLPAFAPLGDQIVRHYFASIEESASWSWVYHEFTWQPPLWFALFISVMMLILLKQFSWKRFAILAMLGLVLYFIFYPRARDLIIRHRFPVALLYVEGSAYLINGGTRSSDGQRDDFKRFFLPALRHQAVKPRALILSTAAVSAHSSISSVVRDYPEIKIYSLVAQAKNFPFPFEFCPQNTMAPLHFERVGSACRLHLGDYILEERQLIHHPTLDKSN